MRENIKGLKTAILDSLLMEAKCTSRLVAELKPSFSPRQIEVALSDLLDLGKVEIDSGHLNENRSKSLLKRSLSNDGTGRKQRC